MVDPKGAQNESLEVLFERYTHDTLDQGTCPVDACTILEFGPGLVHQRTE